MAGNGSRIGVTELLVGVPFPPAAIEIMRCATAPQFFAEAIFGGATYSPIEAVGRGWVHDLVESEGLLDRALEAANALAALPAKAFALSKRQTREPALERMQNREVDAAIEQIWTAPETPSAFAITSRARCANDGGGSPRRLPSQAAANPCSRSAMMSSLSSSPIDRRTTSGPAPAWIFCASVSWRCVVEAG